MKYFFERSVRKTYFGNFFFRFLGFFFKRPSTTSKVPSIIGKSIPEVRTTFGKKAFFQKKVSFFRHFLKDIFGRPLLTVGRLLGQCTMLSKGHWVSAQCCRNAIGSVHDDERRYAVGSVHDAVEKAIGSVHDDEKHDDERLLCR